MTDEQINQRIAEACGWTDIGECTCCVRLRGYPPEYSVHKKHTPNYCNDLNAMHEAEKMLSVDQIAMYFWRLCDASKKDNPFMAIARQRAEAFLRTLGKWEQSGQATEMVKEVQK